MSKEPEKIFSGDYSRDMWEAINSAKTKGELRRALYFVCCRLQELESRLTPRAVDCAYCHCSTAIIRDGVHCINCGRVYKSHSH